MIFFNHPCRALTMKDIDDKLSGIPPHTSLAVSRCFQEVSLPLVEIFCEIPIREPCKSPQFLLGPVFQNGNGNSFTFAVFKVYKKEVIQSTLAHLSSYFLPSILCDWHNRSNTTYHISTPHFSYAHPIFSCYHTQCCFVCLSLITPNENDKCPIAMISGRKIPYMSLSVYSTICSFALYRKLVSPDICFFHPFVLGSLFVCIHCFICCCVKIIQGP